MFGFRTCRPNPQTIHAPACDAEHLRFLYGGLNDVRRLEFGACAIPCDVPTEMSMQVFDFAGVARLAVPVAGADFADKFALQELQAQEKGASSCRSGLNLPGLG